MTKQIDIEKLKTAASKLGMEVKTDSSNSGYSISGKTYSWEELAKDIDKRFIPYRAIVREIKGKNSWTKTSHS